MLFQDIFSEKLGISKYTPTGNNGLLYDDRRPCLGNHSTKHHSNHDDAVNNRLKWQSVKPVFAYVYEIDVEKGNRITGFNHECTERRRIYPEIEGLDLVTSRWLKLIN
ncbi:hypothetical protein TNCV_2051981 [Trichonephila clavipes]|nr:hypothetical protein TNCV_2051981 [Trichonephila clavipes]